MLNPQELEAFKKYIEILAVISDTQKKEEADEV